MRISRLLMPAATLAGALALAGCGGGSPAPGTTTTTTTTTPGTTTPPPTCTEGHSRRTPTGPCELNRETSLANAAMAGYAGSLVELSPGRNADTKPSWLKATATGGTVYSGSRSGNNYDGVIHNTKGDPKTSPIKDETGWNATAGELEWASVSDSGRSAGVLLTQHFTAAAPLQSYVSTSGGRNSVQGTYYGVPGAFECAIGPCTARRDSATKFTLVSGTWHFDPNVDTAMVTKPDGDYLEYGWWRGTNARTDRASELTPYVDSKGALANYAAAAPTLEITGAEYKGDAYGYYALHDAKTNPETGEHGAFTAKVELTANFGDTINANASVVSGEINTFMVGTRNMGWRVELAEQAFDDLSDGLTYAAADAGKAKWIGPGGALIGDGDSGSYAVGAYGTASATNVPAELGGAFHVTGADARMEGAFAAKPQ